MVLNVWFPDVAVKIFLCSGYLIKSSQDYKTEENLNTWVE